MCATFGGVNIVGKGINIFLIRFVILKGYLNRCAFHRTFDIDRIGKEHFFVFIEVANKFDNATFVVINALFHFFGAFIAQCDANPLVEKRHFTKARFEDAKLEISRFKHAIRVFVRANIWPETNGCPCGVGFINHFEVIKHLATLVFLRVDLLILHDGNL